MVDDQTETCTVAKTRITFAWWNTSLSPTGKARANSKEKKVASEVIRYLTRQLCVDCLAIGEITADDVAEILETCNLSDYAFYDGTPKSGRLQFDTGLLYRKANLFLLDATPLIVARGNRSLRLANRVDFLTPGSQKPLHLFVSHWPSRLWCERNGADRHVLGLRLRDAVNALHEFYRAQANVILLGDYNDEPFDGSLAEQLLAVRDRRLVRRNPMLLYNPFWRHLGESAPHVPGKPCRSYAGTCFYKSGVETHWRTFDQIIFSSAFLGRSEWELVEERTGIMHLGPFGTSVPGSSNIFDHFPVLAAIERKG